jgi:hypothetical protein
MCMCVYVCVAPPISSLALQTVTKPPPLTDVMWTCGDDLGDLLLRVPHNYVPLLRYVAPQGMAQDDPEDMANFPEPPRYCWHTAAVAFCRCRCCATMLFVLWFGVEYGRRRVWFRGTTLIGGRGLQCRDKGHRPLMVLCYRNGSVAVRLPVTSVLMSASPGKADEVVKCSCGFGSPSFGGSQMVAVRKRGMAP